MPKKGFCTLSNLLEAQRRKKGEQHWLSKALLLLGLKTIGKKLNAEVSYFSPFGVQPGYVQNGTRCKVL